MVECIVADRQVMDPLIIYTGTGIYMESWFYGSKYLSTYTKIGISTNSQINDKLAIIQLNKFIELSSQPSRLKRSKKRYLIFDGYSSYLILEFLTTYQDNDIILFSFLLYITYLY